MENVGKWLFLGGLLLAVAGGIVWLLAKVGLPLGRLPGDIHMEGERNSFSFPIVTMLLVSVVLTILVNVLLRIFGR